MYDVIIIGAGVAGMSAALWCNELNLKTLILEKAASPGGQLHIVYNPIKNHLGVEAKNGKELCKIFLKQLEKRSIEISTLSTVSEIDPQKKRVFTSNGKVFESSFLVIATGVRRRKLNLEGEEEFKNKGILLSGKKDFGKYKNKSVCVIGGGDAALENALILSKVCKKVFLVHRRDAFRARREFVDEVLKNEKIKVLTNTVVKRLLGTKRLEAVLLENLKTGESLCVDVEGVLIRIGVQPNNELFREKILLDENGYVVVDSNCETNLKNVFAIGDIASPLSPTISTAVGMGATVTKVISMRV